MLITLIVIELFLAFLCAVCVAAVINPDRVVEWTIDRYMRMLKIYGFDAKITATPRSKNIIRFGHLFLLVCGLALMVMAILI